MNTNRKVVLVGAGFVGMSMAYSLLNQGGVNELVLIDVNKDKTVGEEMDLSHGLPYAPHKMKIKAGDYSECKDANIVVITAGLAQKPGQTRLELAVVNAKIMKEITQNVMANGFSGVFIVASNPVDLMSYVVAEVSRMPKSRVIGSGTVLDTARLRYIIGEKININPKSIHTYVIGEHGDSEFVLWSSALIGSEKIDKYLTKDEMIKIESDVRNAAYEIIDRKGATYYGIAMCLTRITNAILNNESSIITVSSYDEENDIYFSTPSVINKDGAIKKMKVELNKTEQEQLETSINVIKEAIKRIE